ncbi:MAG: hypothetical protein NTU51_02975 [Bacteroidetes bacterium]|nr:hypothetical protein [Bacteroidota bacterium]
MKKIFISLVCLFVVVSVIAQEDLSQQKTNKETSDFQTVFGKHKPGCKIQLGYFFEINAAYTMIGPNSVFLPGMSAGVILNHHWTIGLSGSFLGNPHGLKYDSIFTDTVGKPMKPANLCGGYGGLLLEYTLLPKSMIHVSFPVLIGMGYMFFRTPEHYENPNNQNWNYDHQNHKVADTYCFVIEPGVRAEFNLVKMLRMGITLSYRYSPNFDLVGTSTTELNQFNAKLSFRLGKF